MGRRPNVRYWLGMQGVRVHFMSRALTWMTACALVLLLAACSNDPTPAGMLNRAASRAAEAAAAPVPVPTVLILDASGSMTTPDAPGPRIDAAKTAAKSLATAMPDDAHLALVTYGTGTDSSPQAQTAGCQDVTTLLPLGPLDRPALDTAIDALKPSGYTPISLALEQATGLLPTDGAKQAIVLVSDGEDTCGRPPCDVAAQLHTQHPGLAISTVGFRTDGPASDQLACIANTTGGMFVQADNANQLAARLIATQDIQAAKASLSSTGFNGIDLGTSADDIRKANTDFPDVAATGRVVVVWRDCDFTFLDGVLDAIDPHDGGRTIDGITTGSKVSEAIEFYGQPLGPAQQDAGKDWLTFLADKVKGFGYRMAVDGYNSTGTNATGTITRIVLCRCAPHTNERMTFGVVSFVPPDGWKPREWSGGTVSGPLVELAPTPDSPTAIAVWFTDVTKDPKESLDAVKQSGVGGMSTFGGRQVWTYGVNHTVSSRGDEKYVGHWYYLFEGNSRVDVWCDALKDDQSQAALTPICEKFVESIKIDVPAAAPPAPPSGPPVATFEGYGALRIGMTKDEAIAAMGGQPTENHYYSCSVLNDGRGRNALTVWVNDGTGRVTGIEAPPGTVTDRGVGDGSSPAEIRAAYPAPEFTIEEGHVGGQGSEAVNVRNQAGGLMNFDVSSDTGRAEAPAIGRSRSAEGC